MKSDTPSRAESLLTEMAAIVQAELVNHGIAQAGELAGQELQRRWESEQQSARPGGPRIIYFAQRPLTNDSEI